jgi:hypothetical protein
VGALCLAAFVAKCGYELVTGRAILAPDLGEGVRLLPLAHLTGAVLGLLLALTQRRPISLTRSQRTYGATLGGFQRKTF